MANMHYCRFRNTYNDLVDCLNALDNIETDEDFLSNSEYRACARLFKTFVQYLYDKGIINNDGDLEENLEYFLSSIPSEGR